MTQNASLITHHSSLDLSAIQERLSNTSGKDYWRSLEELAETEGFDEMLHREFPRFAAEWNDSVGRRRFLRLMGASLALAGLSACTRQPMEPIAPYVRQPEELLPGKPLYFATAMPLGGVATGVLAESHQGRPTKIEGNPDHPASFGATDAFAQASVLTLYDPDRSQTLTHLGEISAYPAFLGSFRTVVRTQRSLQGAGLRILTETVTSPTLASQLRATLSELPLAKWHQYDPVNRDNVRAGALLAFGESVHTVYRFERAGVIVSLDSDFLSCGPGSVRYAREFASRRRLQEGRSEMNRLYVVEGTPSNTGSVADHRLQLRASEIESFARALARELGVAAGGESKADDRWTKWIKAVASDLQQHRGSGIVIAGEFQPPAVHALAHAMNHALDNADATVLHTEPLEANSVDQTESLRELARDMDAGNVDVLLILGGNPVYNAPADLNFGERLRKVGLRVHLGLYDDETSALCHWHIPEAHYLESWSDARAFDGTASIVQPLIAPLYRGKTAHEILAALMDQPERSGYHIVRDYWKSHFMGGQLSGAGGGVAENREESSMSADFESFWRKALHDGFIPNTALAPKPVTLRSDFASQIPSPAPSSRPPAPGPSGELEIVFRPDPTVYDGRFANNGWLQELPKPLTRLTWDNAAIVSPATAASLNLSYEIGARGGEHGGVLTDQVELEYQGRTVRAPVWILPGHPDDCVTVHLGYGRVRAGRVGSRAGFNAYALRTSDAPWFGSGLKLRKTWERVLLAGVQTHHDMEGRDILRSGTLDEYRKHPELAPQGSGNELSLYPGYEYRGYAWGMTIDLNACIGCGACVVACQAENNIPIVGKTEVGRAREMHWLRVDRYYKGPLNNPETFFQPVPCMHCENAPCEVVCPVAATAHSAEGLNDMVYNRCVGTRYCSNNCPYKVRRFNFLLYSDWETPSLKLMRNPNVTVRSRGVMEKCTYCVQRINKAKIEAEKEDRQVADGEIVTACQAVCPVQAIVFGNVNDPNSRVAKLKSEPRNYGLLADLNTRPRTTYLAAVRNPNPDLA